MATSDIILYNYDFSPFGKRVSAYLAFRGIDYALCQQPFTMPRPDLALLPVHYRRIPVLAIGRHVYLDTRLILRKLEALEGISTARLGATSAQEVFIEELLERYMIEGPVFKMAGGLVPVDVAQEPTFNKDRQGMLGRTWSKEELEEGRGECLNYIKNVFQMLENILADGRNWVLGSREPKLADIHAIFLMDFVSDMELPRQVISDKVFPGMFSWIARYRAAVEKAKAANPKPALLDGQQAADHVFRTDRAYSHAAVDNDDPSDLKEGIEVEIYAADWGTEHRDSGRLVGLSPDEVTIAVKGQGDVEIRVHAPRTGFKVKEIG